MRELRAQNRVCDRAREYSSRSLDGELSDFERALLETHLERCDACRAYAAAVAAAAVAATAGLVGSLQSHPNQARPNPTLEALIRADDFNSQDVQLMHQIRASANAPKKSLVLARSGKKQT